MKNKIILFSIFILIMLVYPVNASTLNITTYTFNDTYVISTTPTTNYSNDSFLIYCFNTAIPVYCYSYLNYSLNNEYSIYNVSSAKLYIYVNKNRLTYINLTTSAWN